MSRNDKLAQAEIESLNAQLEEVQEELELALRDIVSLKAEIYRLQADREFVV